MQLLPAHNLKYKWLCFNKEHMTLPEQRYLEDIAEVMLDSRITEIHPLTDMMINNLYDLYRGFLKTKGAV